MSSSKFSLDELYKMTTHIYSEQNAHRPASATFAHFVEVCGLLTIHTRKKKRESVSFEDALCKALGWYFPLLAKFRVSSVEELIYRKFPYACPYCRECPHVDSKCKTVKGTEPTVNHKAIQKKYVENSATRPFGLNEWQEMFNNIYPRTVEDSSRSVVGLFEELGELAEAVRVYDRFPKYFAGEAADVFSYLMGLANEYNLQLQTNDKPPFDFEKEFLNRFPGLCIQCGYTVCVCPLVPESTVGRMAKELDLRDLDKLFVPSFEVFRVESAQIAERVLDSLGGYSGFASRFPFDRGEANRALVLFCLKLAAKLEDSPIADRLRSGAIRTADSATYPGSRKHTDISEEIMEPIRQLIEKYGGKIDEVARPGTSSLTESVGRLAVEIVLGDKYVAANTLAQGAGAHTIDPRFYQSWSELQPTTDLVSVSEELRALEGEVALMTPSKDREVALTSLKEAQAASQSQDGPRLLQALSKVGGWVVEFGTKVGTEMVVALIKSQYGMQ
jgi:NTP pyrophosphatase (non-canonical NTP hydrolase)